MSENIFVTQKALSIIEQKEFFFHTQKRALLVQYAVECVYLLLKSGIICLDGHTTTDATMILKVPREN